MSITAKELATKLGLYESAISLALNDKLMEGVCYAKILFAKLSRLLLKTAALRCLTTLIPLQFYPDFFC